MMTLALVAGFADRVRGGFPEGRPSIIGKAMRIVIAWCLVAQVTTDWRYFVGAMIPAYLGWQIDNGWRGRWVQWQTQQRDFGLDMLSVLAVWATLNPLLLAGALGFFNHAFFWLFPAYLIGTLAAMFASVAMPRTEFLNLRHAHPWSELLEFFFIVPLFYLFVN